MREFAGYHSEWNLGSPGGWDYQRITQLIGKAVWERLNQLHPIDVTVDFDHPMLFPVNGFVDMLLKAHRRRTGGDGELVAVVAEEETLESVTENRNLAQRLDAVQGISGALMAPHELELAGERVCWKGRPVSVIFMDFNTDVLLELHRRQDLAPLIQAVREGRVINPRGTEPINVKSMFEVLKGPMSDRFHQETVARTPWTRRFFSRATEGPNGESIADLIEWTRAHWEGLVLKPARGYSGKGVRVGGVNTDADASIDLALKTGDYIVQEKIPFEIWAEEIPVLDTDTKAVRLEQVQTDFRCLLGPEGLFGFLSRYGGVPTNVGSGGGVQPMAVLAGDGDVGAVVSRINEAIMAIPYEALSEVMEMQRQMALDHRFTYLLGPIKIALRPRIITTGQLAALERYAKGLWADCLVLERMWLDGELDEIVTIEEEELDIARLQPWGGSPAIIASDGLFGFS